jgi:hypothetical protein
MVCTECQDDLGICVEALKKPTTNSNRAAGVPAQHLPNISEELYDPASICLGKYGPVLTETVWTV